MRTVSKLCVVARAYERIYVEKSSLSVIYITFDIGNAHRMFTLSQQVGVIQAKMLIQLHLPTRMPRLFNTNNVLWMALGSALSLQLDARTCRLLPRHTPEKKFTR